MVCKGIGVYTIGVKVTKMSRLYDGSIRIIYGTYELHFQIVMDSTLIHSHMKFLLNLQFYGTNFYKPSFLKKNSTQCPVDTLNVTTIILAT